MATSAAHPSSGPRRPAAPWQTLSALPAIAALVLAIGALLGTPAPAHAQTVPAATEFLPDGYYGLSKAYGELMGRMYWHKHGVESVFIRIGSACPEPVNARMLASWMSYADLSRLMIRCVMTETVGVKVIWGASDNARMTWWKDDDRDALGWAPQDSADGFAGQLAGKVSGDPVEERYVGGAYCSIEYSRHD